MGYTEIVTHTKYAFQIDKVAKSLVASVRGYYTDEDRKAFEAHYASVVSSIDPTKYELIVECKDLDTFDESLLTALAEVFKVYQATGFHTIKLVEPASKVSFLQLKSTIRKTGVPVVYIKSL